MNYLPLVISWGGGVNSTAMLIGMRQRGIIPDLILFADTGGEKPETYAFREVFNEWLLSVGFPEIYTVQNDGMYVTLENNCLQQKMLPSIAYGFKSCSDKYKAPSARKAREAIMAYRTNPQSYWI
jgi:3''-phosphoadenosine 5''-phosphosulfate sulfotransferase (PAPS reductase)/FAD synthetase and related enzymes